jgi:hypothetical protein
MTAQSKSAPPICARKLRARKQPQPTLTAANPAPSGRASDGRFAAGNAGGPGNPHARHCARMLALLRASISDEELVAIIRMLVRKACEGDVSAAKLIMSYKLGEPAQAPNPDEIDRDEWEHYQKDTIKLEQVQQVLGSLPSSVGNDIARTTLPVVTQARKEAIAGQLGEARPDTRKVTKDTKVATQQAQKDAPIANGNSGDSKSSIQVQRSTIHDQRSTTNHSRSTIHDQRSTTNEAPPIPNRKSETHRPGKAKPKKIKPHWVQQVARRVR